MSDQIKINSDFYVVGGTMKPDAPSYIQRKADNELYEHILKGDFCCVLTPRQMGKSSLMIHTADQLKKEGIRTAIIDLTQIGTEKEKTSADKWYYGIAYRIVRELDIKTKISEWWQEREKLPALQRLTEFFEDVLLPGTNEPVVIFVDEIDTTIALPFTDDFFAAIRACYNARANKDEYRRLNFVLLGVATPSDLIKDTQRTPFNIGRSIHLTDFTLAEAKPLSLGLCPDPEQGEKMLERILYWTGGHPYLTQKLCRIVAGEKLAVHSDETIDNLVEKNFLSPGTNREEPNLKFVSDRLLQGRKNSRKRLKLYRRIYIDDSVSDNPLSPTHTSLKLSGLVLPGTKQMLRIRNRIYERVFTGEWIKEVIPIDWNRNIAVSSAALLLIGVVIYFTLLLPGQYINEIRTAQEDVPIDAYNKLMVIPFYKETADNLFADYWRRCALRNLSQEDRDEGLIYYLKALTIKESAVRRSEASQVIGDDYKNLVITYRHNRAVTSVAFSPDGKTVITGGADKTARLWKATTGKSAAPPMKHGDSVTAVAFSPGGKTVLTGSADGTTRLWDAATGKELTAMKHEDWVSSVAFSPDGKIVLTGSRDSTAQLWQTATGKPVSPPMKHGNWVNSASFSPDGKTILTSSPAGMRLWLTATGKPVSPPMRHYYWINSVAFSPDGKTVLTGSVDWAWLWDITTGKLVAPTMIHRKYGGVSSVAFSPDGKIVLTGCEDDTARLWDAATGKLLAPTMIHYSDVNSVAFSPDGKTLLTGSLHGTARLWEVATGKFPAPPIKHGDFVNTVAISPDGKTVLTGSNDGTARLWQADTGKSLSPPMIHEFWVTSVAFSPDGNTLLTGGADGTARLWDAAMGKSLFPPMIHGEFVTSVAISPDGKTVLTGGHGGTARLWDASTGKSVPSPMKHGSSVTAVAFSPDGKIMLTGGDDSTTRLWDAATGKSLSTPVKHDLSISSVAFSSDGKTVLTRIDDGTVQLWDAATGKPLSPPIKYSFGIKSTALSADGKTIMVATEWWIHQSIVAGETTKPKSSRLLPGNWTGAYRFLDDQGDHMQVAVYVTGDSIKIINLRFDKPDAPPIQGDPVELLEIWQKKLALKLDEKTGKIEPMYPIPEVKNDIRRHSSVIKGEEYKQGER